MIFNYFHNKHCDTANSESDHQDGYEMANG